ncbi:MAG: putative bifunctional diguanylate cyclase/phosphodiesterase [Chroococcales cyanobacterium]
MPNFPLFLTQRSNPDSLPTFAPIILGCTVMLLLVGLLMEGEFVYGVALLLLGLMMRSPRWEMGIGLFLFTNLFLLIFKINLLEISFLEGMAVIFGITSGQFLRKIEWRLASERVLKQLSAANLTDTPEKIIRQSLTLLCDIVQADSAIALRQVDDVTAEAVVCVFPQGKSQRLPLRDKLTTPKLFSEALAQDQCLYYENYPNSPHAVQILVSANTQSLAILPFHLSPQEKGAVLLIWQKHIVFSANLKSLMQSLLGELSILLGFRDTTVDLERVKSRLSAILETIPQGIIFVDESGEQGWVNQAAAQHLDLLPEFVEPMAIAQAMAKLRMRADNCELLTEQGTTFFSQPNQEIRNWKWIFTNPTPKVLSISSTPTRMRNVPGRLWVLEDITEQHFLEEALIQQTQELTQANQELEKAAKEQNKLYQELAKVNQELQEFATHDGLTKIANRRSFDSFLEQQWANAKRSQSFITLILLDVDFFKRYNDTYGHQAGDQCLQDITEAINHVVKRATDLLARYGGEEFAVILPNTNISGAIQMAELIQKAVKAKRIPHSSSSISKLVTISLGVASIIPDNKTSPSSLIAAADGALYQAKKTGRDRYVIFDKKMHLKAIAMIQLENELKQAVEKQQFFLHYQPIVSLVTDQIIGFEALVRWQHPTRGLVSPAEFIPLAESTGLIKPLGWWVLEEACRQLKEWQLRFPEHPLLTMNVNLSGQQLEQVALIEKVDQILKKTEIDGRFLKLEITETCLMETKASKAILEQLKSLGVQLAIDDFGTGYSSLSRLHQFPIDTLKIDCSFVRQMETDTKGLTIVQTIAILAHNLNMTVVAEGIETVSQRDQLRKLQCEAGQGYLFSPPIDSKETLKLLNRVRSSQFGIHSSKFEVRS